MQFAIKTIGIAFSLSLAGALSKVIFVRMRAINFINKKDKKNPVNIGFTKSVCKRVDRAALASAQQRQQ